MTMFLSIIVVSYESRRELPRTLYSLSPHFQQGVSADDYEVIVVDNGSRRPPTAAAFADLGLDLTVIRMEDPTPSPVAAVNRGLDASCGAAMGVFIDGARMASPGLLRRTREALGTHQRAVVGSRGRYLGPMMQRRSMKLGYDQAVEDRLLDRIDWKNNGYGLFDISVFDETARPVWHAQVGETNALFMRRGLWREMGGYDPAFRSPGGGFVNLDAWERACNLPDVSPILLLGEATFHQFHGGIATNTPRRKVDVFRQEYIDIRGRDHSRPTVPVSFWGAFTVEPPEEELIRGRTREPAERMASGPMKGLLDVRGEPTPATGRLIITARGPAELFASAVRSTGRRLPPELKRTIRSAGRRLPPDVKRSVKRIIGR